MHFRTFPPLVQPSLPCPSPRAILSGAGEPDWYPGRYTPPRQRKPARPPSGGTGRARRSDATFGLDPAIAAPDSRTQSLTIRTHEFYGDIEERIDLPRGVTRGCTEEQIDKMVDVALSLDPLWENCLGSDWKSRMTRERTKELYSRM